MRSKKLTKPAAVAMPVKVKIQEAPKPTRPFNEFVEEISGPQGLKIVKTIGEGATDERIEKNTKLKLSVIRSVLNVLHDHGIVEYTREKNMTTGWFTYTWKVNMNRAMQNFLTHKKREYETIRDKLSANGEQTLIYKCPKGCASSTLFFDDAQRTDFSCPTCSARLRFSDGSKQLREMESKLATIQTILGNQTQLQPQPPTQIK
jgi:transcription factor E